MSWRVTMLVGLAAVAGCTGRRGPEPVWVGHLVPLTGPERAAGQNARQGVQLAVDWGLREGQTSGDRRIAFRHADDRGDAARTRAETVRLLAVNKVAALLTGPGASLAEAAVQAARPYGVPVVVPGELWERAYAAGVIALGVGPARRGRILVRIAQEHLKLRRAAVLCDGGDELAADLASAFTQGWPRRPGFEVRQWAGGDSAGLDAVVQRVREWRPGLVLVAAGPTTFAAWRSRLRKAGVVGPLLYGGEDVGETGLGQEALADPDLYLATAYTRTALTPQGQEFARRYEKEFAAPPDWFAAQAYDGARLLILAIHAANSTDAKKVLAALAGQDPFESSTGPVTWEEQRPKRNVFIVGVRNGESRLVQTVAAGKD